MALTGSACSAGSSRARRQRSSRRRRIQFATVVSCVSNERGDQLAGAAAAGDAHRRHPRDVVRAERQQ
jgi:hypothetical protein